jgi:chromate transporter
MEQKQKPNNDSAIAKPLQPATEARSQSLSMISLGWLFFRIGATSFGDTGPLLAIVERDLVDKYRLLTREDITESLTYTRLLPGSTVLQIVSYLGYKLAGWPGSALITAAYIIPSALAMVLLAAGYAAVTTVPTVAPAVNGITAAVVGILLATAYRLGKRNITGLLTVTIGLAAFVAGAFQGVNAALIVVAGGIIGILLLSPATNEQTGRRSL